jgi:hypothetical protein
MNIARGGFEVSILKVSTLCVAIAFSLSSCAGLGSLKFESISHEGPSPEIVKPSAYSEYFKVEVSSTLNDYLKTSGRDAAYVHARFCPISGKEDVTLIAFGPFEGHHDRRHHIYLVARYPEAHHHYSKNFLAEHRAYDLARDRRDVCLSVEVPGYPAAKQSKELRIPSAVFIGGKGAG